MTQPAIPTLDRLLTSFRSLTRAQFPQFDFAGTFEYSIQAATSSSVDCSPTDTTLPLPSLVGIPMRSSLLGDTVTLTPGNRCLVQFVNRDPSRPIIVGADPIPVVSTIDASATMNVGPSSVMVNIAGGAAPLAFATPVTTMTTAISAFVTVLQTTIVAMVSGYSSLTTPQQVAFASAVTALSTAITAENALTPTVKTKAT